MQLLPLADKLARDLLIARTRAHNSRYSKLPDLPVEQIATARLIGSSKLDVSDLLDIPSYGPSFISLWADAKAQGLSDKDCLGYIWRWAKAWPAAWERDDEREARKVPRIDPEVTSRLRSVMGWRQTSSLDLPWEADVKGTRWQVRLNDFPDDYMYTLLVDGAAIGDFHDWPETWDRGEAKEPAAEGEGAVILRGVPDIDPATLLARYQNGEYEAVWRDLVALGPTVHEAPWKEPAWAVARETMRRARHNVDLLFTRLKQLNYEFYGESEDLVRPCTAQEEGILDAAEARGLWIPLSVLAWLKEVGWVDFTGTHPALCFMDDDDDKPGIYADPLEVTCWNLRDIWRAWKRAVPEDRRTVSLELGPDARSKARFAAGWEASGEYSVRLPNAAADGLMEGEPHGITFVEYLRLSFQWGGFPGWEGYDNRPKKELAFLRKGLLPI